jgi:hypothetical protein
VDKKNDIKFKHWLCIRLLSKLALVEKISDFWGCHNFDPSRGIIKIEKNKLSELIKQHAGKGQPVALEHPYVPGYKERIDFGEFIVHFVLKVEGQKTQILPTTKGIIHYAQDGVHVVPSNPNGVIPK